MNKVKVKLIKLHTKIIYNKSNLEINKALKTFAGERRLNQSLHDWNTVGQSPGWRGGCGMEAIESNFLWVWKYLKLWANTRTEHMIWWFHNSKAMTNNWKTDSLKWSIRVQFVSITHLGRQSDKMWLSYIYNYMIELFHHWEKVSKKTPNARMFISWTKFVFYFLFDAQYLRILSYVIQSQLLTAFQHLVAKIGVSGCLL